MRRRFLPLLAGLVLAATACADSTGPNDHPDWSDPTTISFYPGLKVDLSKMTKTAAGNYYQDLVVGDGRTLKAGNKAIVDYTLWRPDGELIQRNEGLEFPIAKDQVIPGWVDALPGMKEGGMRKLVIPPDQAYGDKLTLVFDVTLHTISDTTSTAQ